MWFFRGAQSAVFYYVTCTPCAECLYRRKRKKEGLRQKKAAEGLETEDPHPFRQPTPFSTNIYWREEIAMGPGPPVRRGGHKNDSQRNLVSSGQDSTTEPSSGSTTVVGEDSSPSLAKHGLKGVVKDVVGERWNRIRYQREDEVLWGHEVKEDSSIGSSSRSRAGTGGSGKYYIARNPAVNDLHPPVVSSPPTNKAETRWMLQPPPSAKVMEGKARGGLQSAGSRNSSLRKREGQVDTRLERRIGKRRVEENIRKEDMRTREDALGQRHDRDESHYLDDSDEPLDIKDSPKLKTRPQPITISKDSPSPPQLQITDLDLPKRPPLATIASSEASIPRFHTDTLKASPTFNSRSSSPRSHARRRQNRPYPN